MTRRFLPLLALFCVLTGRVSQGAIIAFDDLGTSNGGTHMPTGYEGLTWTTSDWHYMTVASAPTQTFLALSGTATTVASVGGGDFYFDGADFWSRRGLDANGRFYFFLYRDGVTVYNGFDADNGRQLFDGTHQYLTPNYAGPIDAFAMAFDSGGGDWDHLAMDNLRITMIPEPAALGTLAAGISIVAFGRRRRRFATAMA